MKFLVKLKWNPSLGIPKEAPDVDKALFNSIPDSNRIYFRLKNEV